MAKIVKNLGEANNMGYLSGAPAGAPQNSDIGKIISDVKSIIDGIKEMRGVPQNQATEPPQSTQMNFNDNKTDILKKVPVAVLKVDNDKLEEFLSADITAMLENPNINRNMKVGDLIMKWSIIKELIKPEIKKAIQKIAKAELEYR